MSTAIVSMPTPRPLSSTVIGRGVSSPMPMGRGLSSPMVTPRLMNTVSAPVVRTSQVPLSPMPVQSFGQSLSYGPTMPMPRGVYSKEELVKEDRDVARAKMDNMCKKGEHRVPYQTVQYKRKILDAKR